jgi:hypothetical protein
VFTINSCRPNFGKKSTKIVTKCRIVLNLLLIAKKFNKLCRVQAVVVASISQGAIARFSPFTWEELTSNDALTYGISALVAKVGRMLRFPLGKRRSYEV